MASNKWQRRFRRLVIGFGLGTAAGVVASHKRGLGMLAQKVAARAVPATPKHSRKVAQSHDGEPDDLSQLRKADLYRQAQDANIPGRSAMSRKELISALRAARA